MVDFIRDIITRFGGRYYGTEAEKNAQEYTAGILREYCSNVEVTAFDSPLHAHFESLKLFCMVYVLGLILFKVNLHVAVIIALLNTIFFLGHFVTYRHWLDFLFPKETSWNVTGDIEPTGAATTTILVAGHMDSVREFKWWYRFKHTGLIFTVLAGFLMIFQFLFYLASLAAPASPVVNLIWLFLILATPLLVVYFDMHGDYVVDGALDNLTGVALAVEMAKVFSQKNLKNTRLRIVSFGAEEAALRGSWAYAKANKEKLLSEKALLINLDTIKEKSQLTVVTGEINTLVFFNKENIATLEDSFRAIGTPYKKLPMNVGATDASAFHIGGLPALSIIGMASDKLDPCYHTRLDNIDHLNPDGINALREVLIHFTESWDSSHANG